MTRLSDLPESYQIAFIFTIIMFIIDALYVTYFGYRMYILYMDNKYENIHIKTKVVFYSLSIITILNLLFTIDPHGIFNIYNSRHPTYIFGFILNASLAVLFSYWSRLTTAEFYAPQSQGDYFLINILPILFNFVFIFDIAIIIITITAVALSVDRNTAAYTSLPSFFISISIIVSLFILSSYFLSLYLTATDLDAQPTSPRNDRTKVRTDSTDSIESNKGRNLTSQSLPEIQLPRSNATSNSNMFPASLSSELSEFSDVVISESRNNVSRQVAASSTSSPTSMKRQKVQNRAKDRKLKFFGVAAAIFIFGIVAGSFGIYSASRILGDFRNETLDEFQFVDFNTSPFPIYATTYLRNILIFLFILITIGGERQFN